MAKVKKRKWLPDWLAYILFALLIVFELGVIVQFLKAIPRLGDNPVGTLGFIFGTVLLGYFVAKGIFFFWNYIQQT